MYLLPCTFASCRVFPYWLRFRPIVVKHAKYGGPHMTIYINGHSLNFRWGHIRLIRHLYMLSPSIYSICILTCLLLSLKFSTSQMWELKCNRKLRHLVYTKYLALAVRSSYISSNTFTLSISCSSLEVSDQQYSMKRVLRTQLRAHRYGKFSKTEPIPWWLDKSTDFWSHGSLFEWSLALSWKSTTSSVILALQRS